MKIRKFAALLLTFVAAACLGVLSACNIGGDDGKSVTEVRLNHTEITIEVGGSETLTATVLPDTATNKNVRWTSEDSAVATVENGTVTGVAAGQTKITATSLNGNRTASCQVTVTQTSTPSGGNTGNTPSDGGDTGNTPSGGGDTGNTPSGGTVAVESVTLSPTTLLLATGQTGTLTATVLPADATDKTVTWTSSDAAVASVAAGTVTAVAEGEANITATAGGKTATCQVTVTASGEAPSGKFKVEFYNGSELVETQLVVENEKVTEPKNVTPPSENMELVGWSENQSGDPLFDFDTPIEGNTTLYAVWKQGTVTPDIPDDSPITYTYAGKECAAFEWTESDLSSNKIKVGYKLSSASSYTYLAGNDTALIRAAAESGTARVDIVGLKGGETYDFAITASDGKTYTVTGMQIDKYDRSGYAHFNYKTGVGAYKDDGTLKSGTAVVYVTEATKNTVTATINGKSYTGLVNILNAQTKESSSLVVRIIGTVGAATWNHIEEGGGARDAITPDKVNGVRTDTNVLKYFNVNRGTYDATEKKYKGGDSKDITQKDLKDAGFNTLNTEVYSELNGLSSKIKYDASKDEFDSAWNNCAVSGVQNVTLEGIGEDARIFQWGITWKNCDSIEVRNITFEDYTEDACSFEGNSNETKAADLEAFKSGNYWIHHNTFEEGVNYWDVCNEQDKHDGDGSTDFKGVKNVTLSYNVYNGTHKTGLIGGSDSQTTANITFHHNYYNGCVSRLPLARQANMHMYNNYYKGTTSTSISLRANAYAFIENCYFEGNKVPLELVYGNNIMGAAKLIGCHIEESEISKDSRIPDNHLSVGNDRNASVTSENKFAKNFENDSTLFYYKNGKSDVTEMLTADETKVQIPLVAGVMRRSSGAGGGEVGGGDGPVNPDVGGGSGGESSGGDSETTSDTVIIFSDGAKLLSDSGLVGIPPELGITVTATKTGGTVSMSGDEFGYDGEPYKKGYKLESATVVSITLAQTKTVELYFYDFKALESNPKINGEAKERENLQTYKDYTYFHVTVTMQAGETYNITQGTKELALCYMILKDA